MPRIISRAAARARGLPSYFTGRACKYGHVAERRTSTADCRECRREYVKRFSTRDGKRWRRAHPVVAAALGGAGYARASARQHGLSSPIPPTYDIRLTFPIYAEAVRRREQGEHVSVDHVCPLPIGGLHVAENLAVLTAVEHSRKTRAEAGVVRAAAAYRRRQRRSV
jgi:hypothetical protein